MRAAVLREYGEPLEITTVDRPDIEKDGAIVEVEACGICRSDWHAWQGHGEWADDKVPLGQILGHEPAGEVVDVGRSVERFQPGDRVVIPFSLGDGICHNCRSGHGNVCINGSALGFEPTAPGAFAEAVGVPAADHNLIRLPESINPREAAALGCRYMTAFHALVDRAEVVTGDWLVVHGCGGVGLSAIQLAQAIGARPIAVDIDEEALSRARNFGAVATINSKESELNVQDRLKELTDGGADVSIDALGIAETCRNSVSCLRERGTHVQVGLTTDIEQGEISLPTDWMTRWEIDFVGARGMPPTRYEALFDLIDASDIDLGDLIAIEVSLSEISDRLVAMTDYETAGIEIVTEFSA